VKDFLETITLLGYGIYSYTISRRGI